MLSYLLKLYYRKNTDIEYHTQEFLLKGTTNTIDDIIKKEIQTFNEVNKETGYTVEQYNYYIHVKGDMLKW